MLNLELKERVERYAEARGIQLHWENMLGYGNDGGVWKSTRKTAVKALHRQKNYYLEKTCYQRLGEAGITHISQFEVPRLVDFDDALMIIEIAIVQPPYILDFAKVHLDRRPDFSPEVLQDWEESMVEIFEDCWPEVASLLHKLERFGIYYLDAKPGNISFGND